MSKGQQGRAIRRGMTVYARDGRILGVVERKQGAMLIVQGQPIPQAAVMRVTKDGVYLEGGYDGSRTVGIATDRAEGEIRVPIIEERLAVGKREVELGAVDIRKTVTTEEQTASVTLRRDEVHVEEVDVADRPASGQGLFEEGTIRVRLRGEEAVVAKETVVTGEVVIDKETVTEERQITDTVRRQRVDIDERYQRERAGFEQEFAARSAGSGRSFAEAEPNYRTGFEAGHDERYAGRDFEAIEPELQRDYATRGVGADRWAELREDIRSGWNKARNR